MMILVTYDVNTESKSGQRRLRKVAKMCENYGVRVQNSVFECVVNNTQFTQLKLQLKELIEKDKDSIRFYQLGDNYKSKIEHFGAKKAINVEDVLIL